MKKIIAICMIFLLLIGCATFPQTKAPVQKSNLSVGIVKKIIKKGQTNQTEILNCFGAPNLITKNNFFRLDV